MNDKTLYYIDNIQKSIFYLSLLIIPISILPLPWDITEQPMSLALGIFMSLILFLEIIRLLIRGVVYYHKGPMDFGGVIFLLALAASTLLSFSVPTSLWGMDGRLGTGLVFITTAFVYFYMARSFIKKEEDVDLSLGFILGGLNLVTLLSVLSFWGLNILRFIPQFESLFTVGLPIYSSARIAVLVSGVGLIFSLYLILSATNKKINYPTLILSGFSLLLHFCSIVTFTLTQGAMIAYILLGLLVAICGFLIYKQKHVAKISLYTILGITGGLILLFLLTRIPQIKDFIVHDESKLITQLSLDSSTSWKIATSVFGESIIRALFGMGTDTFSIAYNMYRPLTKELVVLNSTNFTFATNQALTIFANMGIVGLAAWLAFGFYLGKEAFDLIVHTNEEKELNLNILLIDLAIIFIFLSSFFIYYTYIVYILLFLLMSLFAMLKNKDVKNTAEALVLSMSMFIHKPSMNNKRTFTFLIALISFIGVVILNVYMFRSVIASFHVLEAEHISAVARRRLEAKTLADVDKEKILVEAINQYSKATNLVPKNDVYHRRAALLLNQYVDIGAQKYAKENDQTTKKTILENLAVYVEVAIEESRKATDIAPKVYSNWGTRGSIYAQFVGLGLNSYSKSALTAIQESAKLNPLNYELYYNAAQLYVVNDDTSSAMKALNQVLTINPDHIPSLVLLGDLSVKDKDMKQAERYFSQAKRVMENIANTDNEMYKYVLKKLGELQSPSNSSTDTSKDLTK